MKRTISLFACLGLAHAASLFSACGSTTTTDRGEVVIINPDDTPEPVETPPDEPAERPRGEQTELSVGNDPCESDADCVPADCCHAAACVARTNGPSCGDVMCTMECRQGTIDCGGGCLCHEGRCAARLWQGPGELRVQ